MSVNVNELTDRELAYLTSDLAALRSALNKEIDRLNKTLLALDGQLIDNTDPEPTDMAAARRAAVIGRALRPKGKDKVYEITDDLGYALGTITGRGRKWIAKVDRVVIDVASTKQAAADLLVAPLIGDVE